MIKIGGEQKELQILEKYYQKRKFSIWIYLWAKKNWKNNFA